MGAGEGVMRMRSAWINGALVAAAVAVGAFTLAAFHAPTQTGNPPASTSPSPVPSPTSLAQPSEPAKHVVVVKKVHKDKKPATKTHRRHKRAATTTVPTYTPPPPTQPTTAPQPTPSPILPTLPGGGGTQIPVPP
jgi:hypothetical protein